MRKKAFTLAEVFTPYFTGYRKAAFTLAEVLITLGIIGVVASMTLPALINKYQEKVTVTKVKKMYSLLSQGYEFALNEYGTPDLWGFGNRDTGAENEDDDEYVASGAALMRDILFKNIKIIKKCDSAGQKPACGIAKHYYMENGQEDGSMRNQLVSAALADGSSVMIMASSSNCGNRRGSGKYLSYECGWIMYDVNGIKEPNAAGKDVFSFYLTKNGIIPVGTPEETSWPFSSPSGWGRTAWVIYNENLDYLRCSDLSWDGKKKCN